MTISIPDTLTVDNSGKYILSIRLRSDGFSFSGYKPSTPGSFFYRDVPSDNAVPLVDFFKEVFFAHEFFAWTYKQIRIITETSRYTLVPEMLYDEKKKQEFLRFAFVQPGDFALTDRWNGIRIVYVVDPDLYEFCTRSFVNPVFHVHIFPPAVYWERESQISLPGQMFVVIHDRMIDLFCYRKGELLLVNSYAVGQPEDILYYILYVWRQIGFDQERDVFYLHGKVAVHSQLNEVLHAYLRNISPVEIPSEAYLLGGEIAQAPMDLIALSICEL